MNWKYSINILRTRSSFVIQTRERIGAAVLLLISVLLFAQLQPSRGEAFQSSDPEKSKFEEQWAQQI